MGNRVAYFISDKMTVVNDKISHEWENIWLYTITLVTEFELSQ